MLTDKPGSEEPSIQTCYRIGIYRGLTPGDLNHPDWLPTIRDGGTPMSHRIRRPDVHILRPASRTADGHGPDYR